MITEVGRIQFSQALQGDAKAIFELVDKAGLEGMVSKRKDSKYRSGTSTAWLKIKALQHRRVRSPRRRARAWQTGICPDGRARHRPLCRLGHYHVEPRDARTPLAARPAARRAGAEGHEATGDWVWVKPALIGRVSICGARKTLRHASLHDFREEER